MTENPLQKPEGGAQLSANPFFLQRVSDEAAGTKSRTP